MRLSPVSEKLYRALAIVNTVMRTTYDFDFEDPAAMLGARGKLAEAIERAAARGHARLIHPRPNAFARHFPAATRWLMDRFTPPVG